MEYPGCTGLIGAPTFPMLRDSTLEKVFEIYPEVLIEHYNKQDMDLLLANGSKVHLRSLDNPDTIRGVSLLWFHLDEGAQMKSEAWPICLGRLRQKNPDPNGIEWPQQGWVTSTPRGYNWLYRKFALAPNDPEERARWEHDYRLFHCTTAENEFNPPGYLESLLAAYPDDFALQEIEGKFTVVGGKPFFSQTALKEMLTLTTPPLEERQGHTKIWRKPHTTGKYVAGLDPCWGETGAFACLWIMDWQTGEQVAEIHCRLMPDEMARVSVELCREYNDAYLGIEANGDGTVAVNAAIELGYSDRLYYRDWDSNMVDKPGWWTDERSRPVLLGEYEEAVRHGQVRIHCEDAVDEMLSFIRDERGKPGPVEGAYCDHVMAAALAWQMRHSAVWYTGATEVVKMGSYA